MDKIKEIIEDPWFKFSLTFGLIFLFTFTILVVLGFVPSEIGDNQSLLDDLRVKTIESVSNNNIEDNPIKEEGERPIRLMVPNIDINIIVQNPTTRDNVLLDEYLKKGTVRYPDSALLGDGNTLIFGHSSTLSVVNNQAYKALNGIEKLKMGDSIYVDSETSRYTYKVLKVETVNASDEYVRFNTDDVMLTLSTCNSFGKKESRHVVTAVLDNKTDLVR